MSSQSVASSGGGGGGGGGEPLKGISSAVALIPNAASKRVAIVHTEWNEPIISALVAGAVAELKRHGVREENLHITSVPGAFELPFAARAAMGPCTTLGVKSEERLGSVRLAPHVVICIGCLIKGSTMHFEYISEAVCQGIMRLNNTTNVPVIFGVLECLTELQARERAGLAPGGTNHGVEWAASALKMANVAAELQVMNGGIASTVLPVPHTARGNLGKPFTHPV
jgi:6,7-dimethyl-8-ribityllumazine synthase